MILEYHEVISIEHRAMPKTRQDEEHSNRMSIGFQHLGFYRLISFVVGFIHLGKLETSV